ncbi:hypothetical protein, partial [Ruminococcus callidus]
PLFVSSDEKFDDASVAQSLCGIAIDYFVQYCFCKYVFCRRKHFPLFPKAYRKNTKKLPVIETPFCPILFLQRRTRNTACEKKQLLKNENKLLG